MTLIYAPSEDTFLMLEALTKKLKDKYSKILEVGVGSGYILEKLQSKGFKNISGVDINPEAIEISKEKNLNVKESNLFSKVNGKFDVIFFNPPYLPEDQDEDKESKLTTTGGKEGSEIINKFLNEAKKYLSKNAKIYLLTSSLTKNIDWKDYKKTLIAEKKLFFEKLEVWELES